MNNEINEVLHKEIDLIQACITRMADCSFKLKGWYISLATVALTLLIGQGCKLSIIGLFLFGVTTVFWWLDGFFLKTETLYRWKYEWVIETRLSGNLENLYDLNPGNKKMWKDADKKNPCIMKYIISKTLFPLYGTVWLIMKEISDRIALDKPEFEPLTPHTLRHTFATRCIERGMNPKTLQIILGHSAVHITMNLYCHVTEDMLVSEMSKFENGAGEQGVNHRDGVKVV